MNKYELEDLIGEGKFSKVFKGIHKRKQTPIACKMEPLDQPFALLQHECKILQYLYKEGCHFVPQIHWYGLHNNYRCCVMQLYDCDLGLYLQETTLTLQQKNKLFTQMINMIQHIHNNLVVHRDLKPENFMVSNNELYLIDFGLALFYTDENQEHNENTYKEHIIGNRTYASYFILDGNTYSRRDDFLSLGYIYLYILNGNTPWDDPPMLNNPNQYEPTFIRHPLNKWFRMHKQWCEIEKMDNLPNNIFQYLQYAYTLAYAKEPEYELVQNLFV